MGSRLNLHQEPKEWGPAFRAFRSFAAPRIRVWIHLFVVVTIACSFLLINSLGRWGIRLLLDAGLAGWASLVPYLTGVLQAVMIFLVTGSIYILFPVWWLLKKRLLPVCMECGYRLDGLADPDRLKDCRVRCPECGTENDASKWLINREGADRSTGG